MRANSSMRLVLVLVAIAVSFGGVTNKLQNAGAADAEASAMHRGDASRTGKFPGPSPQTAPGVLWQTWLGLTIGSSPVVADGVAYIGSVTPLSLEGGALHAVDVRTGEELWHWRGDDGDGIFASAAVVGDRVFVGTYDGIVAALSVADGRELWRFQAESEVYSSPAVVDGVVYVGDLAGYIYALSAVDGSELWRFVFDPKFDRLAGSSLTVANGTVFGTLGVRRQTLDALVVALDAATGEERWRFAAPDGGNVRGIPVAAREWLFVQTAEGSIFRLNAQTGVASWQFIMPDAFEWANLAYADGVVYAADGAGLLVAIDAERGEDLWGIQLTEGAPLTSSPTIADDLIVVGDAEGVLYAVDSTSGEHRWSVFAGSYLSSPAIVDGLVIVGTDGGYLLALTDRTA